MEKIKEIKELDPHKTYFISVDIGTMDKVEIANYLKKVKKTFDENGIKNTIVALSNTVRIQETTMPNKSLKQYIYEKFDLKVKRVGGKWYTLSYTYDSGGGT